ncbi:hypothetical protein TetV_476 [Tetraselmis virus 1]|uniref:Uncharacterized protein n=1 Tax=Tetraselmis virus 1 TaxID=2060617 RepID=A0A2P0VNS7_9VIRU|nr:hypothetical protein QJ968_gp578 [Tetraselmis virus 1]AUF82558.1 hypothetical protein TetV_476 [Tetraselmis virus 1]
MSILTICIVSAGIATGFYFLNKDMAYKTDAGKKKLHDSVLMVFLLSAAVMFMVNLLTSDDSKGSSRSKSAVSSSKKGGENIYAVPYDYVLGGDPPF